MTKPDTNPTRSRSTPKAETALDPGRARRARKPKLFAAEPAPEPAPPPIEPTPPTVRPAGKLGLVADLLRRPQGARIDELMAATGWQAHTVRGAMSGALKSRLKLAVTSEPTDAGRVYRIAGEVGA